MRVHSVVDVITNSSSTVFSFAKYDDRVVETIKKIAEALGVYDVEVQVYRRYDEDWLQDNFMVVFGFVLEYFASEGIETPFPLDEFDEFWRNYPSIYGEDFELVKKFLIDVYFRGNQELFDEHVADYINDNWQSECWTSTWFDVVVNGKELGDVAPLFAYELTEGYC